MRIFGKGDRDEPNEIKRVEIDERLDGYRHAHWDPYGLLVNDLRTSTLEANASGYHLWDSTERLQMLSTAAWMASCRQVIGNSLLDYAQSLSSNNQVPADLAEVVLTNYEEAKRWLEFREGVASNFSYELDSEVDVRITWPQPDLNTVISLELMNGVRQVFGQLQYIYHPAIDAVVESAYRKRAFEPYRQRLTREMATLQSRVTLIEQSWAEERINPNVEPGKTLYVDMTRLLEDFVLHGVHELVPITQDKKYLAAVRQHRIAPVDDTPRQPFDPTVVRPPQPRRQPPSGRPFVFPPITTSRPQTPRPFIFPALPVQPGNKDQAAEKPFDPDTLTREDSSPAGATHQPESPFDPSGFLPEQSVDKRPFDPKSLNIDE